VSVTMSEQVLAAIRNSLENGPIAAVRASCPDAKGARLVPRDRGTEQRIALFRERAESAGANVHLATDVSALKAIVRAVIPAHATVAKALTGRLSSRLRAPLSDLAPQGCSWIEVEEPDARLFALQAAITDVDSAIAETGSIVLSSSRQCRRLISLIAEIHIALIWPEQIVSDLLDWCQGWGEAAASGAAGGLTIISGPSKTADIELNLVIGVHGPYQLHLIVMSGKDFAAA